MRVADFSQAVTGWDLSGEELRRQTPTMGTRGDRARPWPPAGLALLTLVSLAACGDVSHLLAGPPTAPQAHRPAATPPSAIPLHAAARPAKAPTAVASEPLPSAQPPIVLTGLTGPELLRLFGEPAARSPSGEGERWTYRAGACELEVFVFPDVAHGQPSVLDERLSAGLAGPDPEQACLRKLRDDHAL
jgi:hypothetical protein